MKLKCSYCLLRMRHLIGLMCRSSVILKRPRVLLRGFNKSFYFEKNSLQKLLAAILIFFFFNRTCGGGVKISSRNCDSPAPRNGGKFCIGERSRVLSCNYEDCKDNADFRAQQCAAHNGKSPRGYPSATNWEPKYSQIKPRDQCKLTCIDKMTGTYVVWSHQVQDGTPCSAHSTDICVRGECRKAGCDHILNSKTKFNKCGICGGSRKSCKRIKSKCQSIETKKKLQIFFIQLNKTSKYS